MANRRMEFTRHFLFLVVIGVSSGCGGKVPTWDEMTNQSATPGNETKTNSTTQSTTIAPAAEDPAVVLAWFKSLGQGQLNDQALVRLTSLKSGLDQVTSIDGRGSAVTDEGLKTLAKLPALQTLMLDATGITNDGLKSLEKVPSLQNLSLNSTRISEAGFTHLAALPSLKRMELMNCNLTQADFAAIGKLPAIEALVLNRVLELNDPGLDLICEATTLKSLQMNECIGLTDKGLVALAKAPGMEELSLNKANIAGVGIGQAVAKGGLKSLRVLEVSATPLSLPGARAINSLKTLEKLNISHVVGMNDVFFLEFVEGMKNLKELNIEGNKGILGQSFSKMKVTANSLETLNARDSGVMDQGLGFLRTHKKLRFIDLSNTPVTLTGVQQFKKLVPTCEMLYAGTRY